MYRNNYTIQEVVNWNTLYESLALCQRCKMWKDSMLAATIWSDFNFITLMDQLYSGIIRISDFWHTIIFERGKERLLCSLKSLDRIEQKAINRNFLLPAFVPSIIRDNVASLEGRGMDDGLRRMTAHLQKAYHHYGTNFYISKADIHGYFDNIPHDHCLNMVASRTQDPILFGFFEQLFKKYKYDTMIHNGECIERGIGLGGEVPQTFGILCLNEYDHICKEMLQIPYYIRYMDDIIMIHPDKGYLAYCLQYLEEYLATKLGLHYNKDKTVILPAKEGVKFLKFHFYIEDNGHVWLRHDRKSVRREKRKLTRMAKMVSTGELSREDFMQSFMSYRGHIKRGNTHELVNYLDQLVDYLIDDVRVFDSELDFITNDVNL